MLRVFLLLLTLCAAMPAHAQIGSPEVERILRDIIAKAPTGSFPPATAPQIQAVPVTVDFDMTSDIADGWLTVTALGRDGQNLSVSPVLGEVKILLSTLTAPITVTIPVPRDMASAQSQIRVTGRVETRNAQPALRAATDALYNSTGPAMLRLTRPQSLPQSTPSAPRLSRLEIANGTVTLAGSQTVFDGAQLTVQLVEAGLAGGTQTLVKGETIITVPHGADSAAFALSYGVPEGGFRQPLALTAWISDWAERKTHVMPGRIDYKGPDIAYSLRLDALRQGAEVAEFEIDRRPDVGVIPPDNTAPDAALAVQTRAIFPAYRGLPQGSLLTVELVQNSGGGESVLSRADRLLDGLSGDIDVSLPPVQIVADRDTLSLRARITTVDGTPLFTLAGASIPPSGARALLRLVPTPDY